MPLVTASIVVLTIHIVVASYEIFTARVLVFGGCIKKPFVEAKKIIFSAYPM